MHVWNVLHAARWNIGRKSYAKNRHQCTIAQLYVGLYLRNLGIYRQSEKVLNGNISSTCRHNMVNFGPLTAEICWRVWGTPTNFNGFRILPSLLHRRRSTEANQTLHDVWPSHGLHGTICTHFHGLLPRTEFCQLQNSICVHVLLSPILAALLYDTWAWASAKLCGVVQGIKLLNIHTYYFILRQNRRTNLRRWTFAEGATYIRHGGHHVGHRPHSSSMLLE